MKASDSTNMPADNSVHSRSASMAVRGESIAEFSVGQQHYSLVCHRDLTEVEELESEWQALENASPEGFDSGLFNADYLRIGLRIPNV